MLCLSSKVICLCLYGLILNMNKNANWFYFLLWFCPFVRWPHTHKTMIACNDLMCQRYGVSLSHFVGPTHQLGLQLMRDASHETSTSQFVVFVSLYLTGVWILKDYDFCHWSNEYVEMTLTRIYQFFNFLLQNSELWFCYCSHGQSRLKAFGA